ncbi:MAG: UDP-glucose 6-dehydrogenase [Alphaproteobacteria bacterium]|nr:UDP-glucose 6-dehydrogenase [Alphaproteobacteria bacterium]
MTRLAVGIIGCGFVGGALKQWLAEHNAGVRVLVSDPAKGYHDAMDDADVLFISIHLPTDADGTQDLSGLEDIIRPLPDKPVFIRTTILPGASARLSRETGHAVYFMPEFLTERTAYADFCTQPMIFTGETDLLKRVFIGKTFIEMTSLEAEIAKYAHNVFGALKVIYCNGVNELCAREGADYAQVRAGMLLSGYINAPHTQVPGPDGRPGYGGKCFPKDVNAFTALCRGTGLHELLEPLKSLNIRYRGEDG